MTRPLLPDLHLHTLSKASLRRIVDDARVHHSRLYIAFEGPSLHVPDIVALLKLNETHRWLPARLYLQVLGNIESCLCALWTAIRPFHLELEHVIL